MTRVLVTGAAGGVGTQLVPRLREHYDVVASDLRPGPGIRTLDVSDQDALAASFEGIDVVVHLAGVAHPGASWGMLKGPNVDAVPRLLDAAVEAGVSRVILTSSLHTLGGHIDQGASLVLEDARPRPCCPYGAAKLLAEGLGAAWSDLWGISVLCLRLGGVAPRPMGRSWLDGWLSPDDLGRLYVAAIDSAVQYGVFTGISANTNSAWDTATTRSVLGYSPHDDSAAFADVPDDTQLAPLTAPHWGSLHRS